MEHSICYRPVTESYGIPKVEFMEYVQRNNMLLRNLPPLVVNRNRRCWLDIPYCETGGAPRAMLDIYLPREGEGPYPVAVFVHGGGWMSGDKRDIQLFMIMRAVAQGYAVVSVGYSLSFTAEFPTQVCEVKTALRFLRAHAGQYSLDTDRMALLGPSAGGHLAAITALSGPGQLDEPALGWRDEDCRVSAVVDWYGPIDFSTADEQFRQSGTKNNLVPWDAIHAPAAFFLGRAVPFAPELVQLANPENYIHAAAPPFYIVHGTDDQVVPHQQSEIFAKKLQQVLGPERAQLELANGRGHGDVMFAARPYAERVIGFLDKWLRPDLEK